MRLYHRWKLSDRPTVYENKDTPRQIWIRYDECRDCGQIVRLRTKVGGETTLTYLIEGTENSYSEVEPICKTDISSW